MVQIKQFEQAPWYDMDDDEFFRGIGFMQPILVRTEQEFDYLWAMQLMIGREFIILLDGRDENPTDLPPSIVRFML